MGIEISLKDRDLNSATSWDVLLEIDDETYGKLQDANIGDDVEFEAEVKQGYTGNSGFACVKPKYLECGRQTGGLVA